MWELGDYGQVAARLEGMGSSLLDAVSGRRGPVGLAGARLVDAACGTGNVALEAARRGAVVTGVDVAPGLVEQGRRAARSQGLTVDWLVGDLGDRGTADRATARGGADVVVSCLGHVFVPDAAACSATLAEMLRSGAVLGFTAWEAAPDDPSASPLAGLVSVCEPSRSPQAWGDPAVLSGRLHPFFADIRVEHRWHGWEFASPDQAADWFLGVSPLHVAVASGLDGDRRKALREAFVDAFSACVSDDGQVRWRSPYVLATAIRR